MSGGLKVCAATTCFVYAPLNEQAAFELFWGFEKQPALFQVARGECVGSTYPPCVETEVV